MDFPRVSKKTNKPIKLRKSEKKTKKKRINQLKNHKKFLVWFDYDFQSLKPIESSWFNQAST